MEPRLFATITISCTGSSEVAFIFSVIGFFASPFLYAIIWLLSKTVIVSPSISPLSYSWIKISVEFVTIVFTKGLSLFLIRSGVGIFFLGTTSAFTVGGGKTGVTFTRVSVVFVLGFAFTVFVGWVFFGVTLGVDFFT